MLLNIKFLNKKICYKTYKPHETIATQQNKIIPKFLNKKTTKIQNVKFLAIHKKTDKIKPKNQDKNN